MSEDSREWVIVARQVRQAPHVFNSGYSSKLEAEHAARRLESRLGRPGLTFAVRRETFEEQISRAGSSH